MHFFSTALRPCCICLKKEEVVGEKEGTMKLDIIIANKIVLKSQWRFISVTKAALFICMNSQLEWVTDSEAYNLSAILFQNPIMHSSCIKVETKTFYYSNVTLLQTVMDLCFKKLWVLL